MDSKKDFSVRHGIPEDAALLSVFGKKTFFETWEHTASKENLEIYMDESYAEEKIRMELSSPAHVYLMLEEEGRLLGFAKLEESAEPPEEIRQFRCLEINKLYLDSHSKGKGFGAVLMDASLELARVRQIECIYLGVWEENIRAVKLYTRYGFTPFGRHRFVMGTQVDWDVWMKRELVAG